MLLFCRLPKGDKGEAIQKEKRTQSAKNTKSSIHCYIHVVHYLRSKSLFTQFPISF